MYNERLLKQILEKLKELEANKVEEYNGRYDEVRENVEYLKDSIKYYLCGRRG